MGLGPVTEVKRTDDGIEVRVDEGGDRIGLAHHLAPPGIDAPPIAGVDYAGTAPAPGSGAEQVVGYHDPKNDSVAADGEFRAYGRDPSGKIVNEVWLKGDGSVLIKNDKGTIEVGPDAKTKADIPELEVTGDLKVGGDVKVTGKIEAGGEIKADLEITWMSGSTPTKGSTHTHPSAMGPTGPPIPGS